jgi:hypothetical protein
MRPTGNPGHVLVNSRPSGTTDVHFRATADSRLPGTVEKAVRRNSRTTTWRPPRRCKGMSASRRHGEDEPVLRTTLGTSACRLWCRLIPVCNRCRQRSRQWSFAELRATLKMVYRGGCGLYLDDECASLSLTIGIEVDATSIRGRAEVSWFCCRNVWMTEDAAAARNGARSPGTSVLSQ